MTKLVALAGVLGLLAWAPTHAAGLDCLTGFANFGVADANINAIDGARFHASGGNFCTFGDRVQRLALRNLVGLAKFQSPVHATQVNARYWLAEVNLFAEFSQRAHLYGTVGLGAYHASLYPTPRQGERRGIYPGYNAGLSIAFPIEDGPGIVAELIWHNTTGPVADEFFTLTIGIGGF